MSNNKELFVVISEEHYKESGTYEAFKTLKEAKEWEHCGPAIKYVAVFTPSREIGRASCRERVYI